MREHDGVEFMRCIDVARIVESDSGASELNRGAFILPILLLIIGACGSNTSFATPEEAVRERMAGEFAMVEMHQPIRTIEFPNEAVVLFDVPRQAGMHGLNIHCATKRGSSWQADDGDCFWGFAMTIEHPESAVMIHSMDPLGRFDAGSIIVYGRILILTLGVVEVEATLCRRPSGERRLPEVRVTPTSSVTIPSQPEAPCAAPVTLRDTVTSGIFAMIVPPDEGSEVRGISLCQVRALDVDGRVLKEDRLSC